MVKLAFGGGESPLYVAVTALANRKAVPLHDGRRVVESYVCVAGQICFRGGGILFEDFLDCQDSGRGVTPQMERNC
jgi:hypothetical protein